MRFLVTFLLSGLGFVASAHAVTGISVEIGHVQSDFGEARDVGLEYALGESSSSPSPLQVRGRIRAKQDQQWSELALGCASLSNPQAGEWRCSGGKLASQPLNTPFDLVFSAQEVQGRQQLKAEVSLQQASFNDEAGLHAGEQVSGRISLALSRAASQPADWQWQTEVDWTDGEIFWQPFYFAAGGHHFEASGSLDEEILTVEQASLSLKDVGQATMSGLWQRQAGKLDAFTLQTSSLDMAALYPLVLKPLLQKTAYGNLKIAGRGSLRIEMRNGEYQAFRLVLQQADLEDGNGRFALYKIDADLPWSYDEMRQLKLAYAGGKMLDLALGPAALAAQVERYALTADLLELPVLDGALRLQDVSAAWAGESWHWHLRANLTPISMPAFTQALGWPTMQGELAATIPLVTYSGGRLTTDGDMHFKVFNGSAVITNLALQEPLGLTPRLWGDLRMRNLDLGALTRTFSFGAIEGRLDGDVAGLQLAGWKPVQFDAALYSSPGKYKKKISQRAVENISALGGAGAAAAIQRSFLRFFDEFNYASIGLSCRLRNGNCLMGGIESVRDAEKGVISPDTSSAAFVIVKGSGVPAITVMGYNHHVSWDELLNRLQRITAGNAPIIE